MFADQPYSEVVNTHGESAMRELTRTFSTFSSKHPSGPFMRENRKAIVWISNVIACVHI